MPADSIKTESIFVLPYFDKIAHLFMFFMLSGALILDISKYSEFKPVMVFLLSAFISVSMGGLIEIAQTHPFVRRSSEWLDFATDIIGALLAILFFLIVPKVRCLRRVF